MSFSVPKEFRQRAPRQLVNSLCSDTLWTPDRRLWFAVLLRAIWDATALVPVRRGGGRRKPYREWIAVNGRLAIKRDAQRWIMAASDGDPGRTEVGSLTWIAYELSDEPEEFIRAVQKLVIRDDRGLRDIEEV